MTVSGQAGPEIFNWRETEEGEEGEEEGRMLLQYLRRLLQGWGALL